MLGPQRLASLRLLKLEPCCRVDVCRETQEEFPHMPTARAQEEVRKPTGRKTPKREMDAIQLRKGDHREVEGWFEEFEKSRSDDKKAKLAHKICKALTVHTQIEEEIFYPAFLEATGDEDMHDEAQVEHDGAKKLIGEIEAGQPGKD